MTQIGEKWWRMDKNEGAIKTTSVQIAMQCPAKNEIIQYKNDIDSKQAND